MQWLRALVLKELRVLGRDRHGLAVLFVMPAVFILIMSMALRDAMDPGRATLEYLWLDHDDSYFAREFGEALRAHRNLVRVPASTEPQLRARIDADEAPFGLYIPAGLADRIAAADTTPAPLVRLYLSPTAPAYARMLFVAQVRAALAEVQAEYLIEDEMGVPHDDAVRLRNQTNPSLIPVEEIHAGSREAPNAVQQSVPSWLAFAMFFVLLPVSTNVLAERDQGNLQRLALLGVSPVRLLGAKFPAYYLVNLVQLALMLAVGVYVVPVLGGDALEIKGSAVALWLVSSALSVAAIGFALLIAVIARTTVQATTLGGVANLILGALGGIMVPKLVMPPLMQTASVVSPMSWALEGYWDILLRGGGVADVLPEAAALAAFGLTAFAIACALFPRTGA